MTTEIKKLIDDYTGKSIYNLHNEDAESVNKRYKKDELLDIAKELGVEVDYVNMNKKDLIDAIQQTAYRIEYESKTVLSQLVLDDSTGETLEDIPDEFMEEIEYENKSNLFHQELNKLLTNDFKASYFNGKEVVTTALPITSDEIFITCEYTYNHTFTDYNEFREYIMNTSDNILKSNFRLWENKWKKLSIAPNRWENNAGKLNNEITPMYKLETDDAKRIADKYIKIVEGYDDE